MNVKPPPWYPAWVERLDLPVWASGPDRKLRYLNSQAEKLLEISATDSLGKPCSEVVAGREPYGAPYCEPDCPLRWKAEEGQQLEPITLRVAGGKSPGRLMRIVAVPVVREAEEDWCLVECALDFEPAERMKRYLVTVAARTQSSVGGSEQPLSGNLTERECEVLERLASAQQLRSIARELHISYATVRNHVQHILGKLGVHSIEEAVARYLLRSD